MSACRKNKTKITLERALTQHQSLLKALETLKCAPYSSCRGGFCGACVVTVESGSIEHIKDPLGYHDEKTQVLSCIARIKSDKATVCF